MCQPTQKKTTRVEEENKKIPTQTQKPKKGIFLNLDFASPTSRALSANHCEHRWQLFPPHHPLSIIRPFPLIASALTDYSLTFDYSAERTTWLSLSYQRPPRPKSSGHWFPTGSSVSTSMVHFSSTSLIASCHFHSQIFTDPMRLPWQRTSSRSSWRNKVINYKQHSAAHFFRLSVHFCKLKIISFCWCHLSSPISIHIAPRPPRANCVESSRRTATWSRPKSSWIGPACRKAMDSWRLTRPP